MVCYVTENAVCCNGISNNANNIIPMNDFHLELSEQWANISSYFLHRHIDMFYPHFKDR